MTTVNLLHQYNNGNYTVSLFSDGTKIRETSDDYFVPSFAENIDLKITNYCDAGCGWCHEMSTTQGKHANLNLPFVKSFFPGQELAIGGGNPLDHPNLREFLVELKINGVIANLTVNQFHFAKQKYYEMICDFVENKLVYGVGISLTKPTDNFIQRIKPFNNAVIHVINNVHTEEMLSKLYNHNLKILILGYKDFGRGNDWAINKRNSLYDCLPKLFNKFQVVSFDNLAIEQLKPQRFMTKTDWESFYMGDDGNFTFYIDAVEQKFAKCSFDNTRFNVDNLTVQQMFNKIRTT